MKNMRKIAMFCLLFSASILALAVPIVPFQGWDWTIEKSDSIVLVRCISSPVVLANYPEVSSDIDVQSVLKGTNGLGLTKVKTLGSLKQGDWYLIFSSDSTDHLQAFEDYRVVALGPLCSTNMVTGNTLNERLGSIFKHRLIYLNQEIQKNAEEKKRLEIFLQP